jgi:hypothetical protein
MADNENNRQEPIITPCKVVLWVLLIGAAYCAGAVSYAQLIPPPPAVRVEASDGFTSRDRDTLQSVYLLCRSMRAKLFPLEEEERILRLKP